MPNRKSTDDQDAPACKRSPNFNANTNSLSLVQPSKDADIVHPSSCASRRLDAAKTLNRLLATTSKFNATAWECRKLPGPYAPLIKAACSKQHTFIVIGSYPVVRDGLLQRGWLQKLSSNQLKYIQRLPVSELLLKARAGNNYERAAISRSLLDKPAHFIWQPRSHPDNFMRLQPYRNRIRHTRELDFTNKIGLTECARQSWYYDLHAARMNCPRCYKLHGDHNELLTFTEDYYRTQCIALLRHICAHSLDAKALVSKHEGSVELSCVEFALKHLQLMLCDLKQTKLEGKFRTSEQLQNWHTFLANSSDIVQGKALKASVKQMELHISTAKQLLSRIDDQRPDLKGDGCRNLWILKPGRSNRGEGIAIKSDLQEIKDIVQNSLRQYIAQKYVERPLLIYNTKFDIRQYMLHCIDACKIHIWLYTDCYFKFSSRDFSLDMLDESVHLTNHTVQRKYANQPNRDVRLPSDNMWSLKQFQNYLRDQCVTAPTWPEIYEGFCHNLIAVTLASLDGTTFVRNAFELYGVDFMLDECFKPILIEVNASPDLTSSTKVTAEICSKVQEDLLKVIVDLNENPLASCGEFKKICSIDHRTKKMMMNSFR